jgi:hypothetical protein
VNVESEATVREIGELAERRRRERESEERLRARNEIYLSYFG